MRCVEARLLLAGGKPLQVRQAQSQAERAGLGGIAIFAGERPAPEMPAYLAASDVLVSPRSRGTNTPLKIYQYLRSGKAIVATRLLTHTQVLSDDIAILTEASPEAFARGILEAIDDPFRAAQIGQRARALAETKYSYDAYLAKTRQACEAVGRPSPSAAAVKDVA
jgi:glycosyltransferase involved in cell wall biosynthesis